MYINKLTREVLLVHILVFVFKHLVVKLFFNNNDQYLDESLDTRNLQLTKWSEHFETLWDCFGKLMLFRQCLKIIYL